MDVVLEVGHGPYLDRWGHRGFEKGATGVGTTEYDEVSFQAEVIAGELAKAGLTPRILDPVATLTGIGKMARGSQIFVSLHLNAFNKAAQGTETLIHRAGTYEDERLAHWVQDELVQELRLTDRGVRRMGLAVLGSVPPSCRAAILCESFFIDAMDSATQTRDWTRRAGQAIARAVIGYAA